MLITGIRIFFAFIVLNDSCSVLLLLKTKISGGVHPDDEQKQQIIALRRDGAGYGRIAARLQISINTVKSFCRPGQRGQSVSSAESRLNRIRDGSGKGSATMPAGISGGMHIWSW